MELNDEDGIKDLTNYRTLQKMMADYNGTENKDTNTLYCMSVKNTDKDFLLLNNTFIYQGDDLNNWKRIMPENEYNKLEKITLKAHTLLASITARMMKNDCCTKDSGIAFVFKDAYEVLKKELNSSRDAFKTLQLALFSKESVSKIGTVINHRIDCSMQKFFK